MRKTGRVLIVFEMVCCLSLSSACAVETNVSSIKVSDFNPIQDITGGLLFTLELPKKEGNILYFLNLKNGKGNVVLSQTQISQAKYPGKQFFALSPDNTRLAYFDAQEHLALLDINTGKVNKLVRVSSTWQENKSVMWSHKGDKLILLNNNDFYIIDGDGRNMKRLVQHSVHSYLDSSYWSSHLSDDHLLNPVWFPDRQTLLYNRKLHETGFTYSNMTIYKVNTETLKQKELNSRWGILAGLNDGNVLVQEYTEKAPVLKLMDDKGNMLKELVRLPETCRWEHVKKISPDGGKLAFKDGDRYSIMEFKAENKKIQNLNLPDVEDETLIWSPNGKWVGGFHKDGTFYTTNVISGESGSLFSISGDINKTRVAWITTKIGTVKSLHRPMRRPPLPTNEIIFVSNRKSAEEDNYYDDDLKNYDIFIMNPDESNIRNLSSNTYYDGWPTPSPDGKKIAFLSMRRDTDGDGWINTYHDNKELYVMNRDGSNHIRVSNLPKKTELDSTGHWSSDGKKLAFTSHSKSEKGETRRDLYVVNHDGSNQKLLLYNVDTFSDFSWSPDNRHIAIGGDKLTIINTEGKPAEYLHTTCSYPVYDPAWSPDGKYIAFVCTGQEKGKFPVKNEEIRIIKTDGSEEMTLLDSLGAFDDGRHLLRWSPDNSKIAFISWVGDREEKHGREMQFTDLTIYMNSGYMSLFIINRNGKNAHPVAHSHLITIKNCSLSWSTDGEWLLFSSGEKVGIRHDEIYYVHTSGESMTKLAKSDKWKINNRQAMWLP